MFFKIKPMTGFEPRTSGIGSNHCAKCATTTALNFQSFVTQRLLHISDDEASVTR